MKEFCPDCGANHEAGESCQDIAAQARRLERLRRREVEAIEKLSAPAASMVLSFPHEAFKLLPALIAVARPDDTPAGIAIAACNLVDAVVAESGKRWTAPPAGWTRPGEKTSEGGPA